MRSVILWVVFAAVSASVLSPSDCTAVRFDASVPPKGAWYVKTYPKFFATSAHFNDSGRAISLAGVSQMTYIDTPLEIYYGVSPSLMAGVMLPLGYVREAYDLAGSSSATRLGNPWLIVKHQFWSEVVVAASSLRIKIPITEADALLAGFDRDDKQIDLYPIYYMDWQMSLGTYVYGQIGYKYRMKNGDVKPSDELKLVVETGYAIVPGIVRMFTFSDFTKFFAGNVDGETDELSSGYLYRIGAGVRFFVGRNLRVEVFTNADPLGRNQFRGIGGCLGIGYVAGL